MFGKRKAVPSVFGRQLEELIAEVAQYVISAKTPIAPATVANELATLSKYGAAWPQMTAEQYEVVIEMAIEKRLLLERSGMVSAPPPVVVPQSRQLDLF